MKRPPASPFAALFLLLAASGVPALPAHAQQPQSTPPPLVAPPLPPGPPAGAPKVEVPPSAGQSLARQLNEAFVNVFQHVAPAVVVVDVSKENDGPGDAAEVFGDFFNFHPQPDEDSSGGSGGNNNGKDKDKDKDAAKPPGPPAPSRAPRPRRSQSEGSGFIIQPDGYILTNNHVVTGASKIDVRLRDGRSFPARLVGADEKTDIAVIKVDAQSLPTTEFVPDSDNVRVGELCFAIGVPYKQEYTFTQGIVSAKNRDRLNMAQYEDYIQTDASINPGNSGGPLLDLDGHVIGMNTLINGFNRGLGFAIPSNMLRDVGGQLVKNGRIIRPYLGVRIETLTDAANTRDAAIYGNVKKGVIVISMEMDAPAAKSDLRPADVITEVDGVPVGTDRELQKQVLGKKVGQIVQLTVVRKGKTLKVPVTTRELPGEGPVVAAANTGGTGDRNKESAPPAAPRTAAPDAGKDKTAERLAANLAGLQVDKLTREVAENLGLDASETGVVVTRVAEDSPAGRAGIQVKDVITEVANRPVNDSESLREALRNSADPKAGTLIYLARGGARTFVVLRGS